MDESFWLVIQYPLKSAKGTQRDCWLRDKVMEYLEVSLAGAGLGYVDGYDMGKCISNPKQYALNIFCVVRRGAKYRLDQKGFAGEPARLYPRKNRYHAVWARTGIHSEIRL
ncbi:hypothetical protein ACTHPF_18615 [Paenibacillus sp. SAF-054]|uniref:hypothetical protein n=1 Tax=unclassified Paenibacillus TaxID=185978 RepID=UPI003F8073B0